MKNKNVFILLSFLFSYIALAGTSPPLYQFTAPLSITNGVVSIPAASAVASGYVTTGVQTLAGAKTFSGAAQFNAGVNGNVSFTAPFFATSTSGAAQSGTYRLINGGAISWRNPGGTGDIPLSVDGSSNLTFNGNVIAGPSGVLPVASGGTGISSYTIGDTIYASGTTAFSKLGIGSNTTVMVSNGSAPTWAALVNANISNSAAIAYSKLNLTGNLVNADINASAAIAYSKLNLAGSILNADIASGAAIAVNKLAALAINRVLASDGSGFMAATTTSTTQVQYLASATGTTGTASTNVVFSASPTFTGTVTMPSGSVTSSAWSTGSSTLAVGGTATMASGSISSSAWSTGSSTLTVGGATTLSALTASTVPYLDGSKVLTSSAVTPTQLSYVDFTSSGQTQMNTKAPSASPTFTGTVTLPSGTVSSSAWDTGTSTFTSNGVAFTAKAPSASPTFTGTVTLPSGTVSSSAWDTGTSTFTSNGIAFTAKAPSASPTFTGTVTLPSGTVSSSAWDTGTSTFTSNGVAFTAKAPLASPTFTGTVTLPSGSVSSSAWDTGTSTFTSNGVAFTAKAPAASPTFTGTVTLPSGSVTSGAWDTGSSTLTSNGVAFTSKAPLASPTFSGTVTLPSGSVTSSAWSFGTSTFGGSGVATFTGQLIGKGTTTNDSPPAGYIGQIVECSQSSFTDLTTPNDYNDVCSMALTAGDWMVSGQVEVHLNGATVPGGCYAVVLNHSGGNQTGSVDGKDTLQDNCSTLVGAATGAVTVKPYRFSTAGSDTVYVKARLNVTTGTPQAIGSGFALRVR